MVLGIGYDALRKAVLRRKDNNTVVLRGSCYPLRMAEGFSKTGQVWELLVLTGNVPTVNVPTVPTANVPTANVPTVPTQIVPTVSTENVPTRALPSPQPPVEEHPAPKQERLARLKATFCEQMLARLVTKDVPRMQLWSDITQLYNHGLYLPELFELAGTKTERALRFWLSEYQAAGRDYFALARSNSAVSQGRCVTAVEAAFLQKTMLHRNAPKLGSAISLLKAAEREHLLESPSSLRTLRRWWEDFEHQHKPEVTLARHGSTYLSNVLMPSLIRDTSLLKANDVWVADGHELGFDVIDPASGKAKRMTFITWQDFASRWFVGGELAFTEHSQHVYSALRNSILNDGGPPRLGYLDNGKAFKAKIFTGSARDTDFEVESPGIFAKLGMDCMFAWPYNARSKPIERAFRTLQEQLERFISSWRGANVADKPADLQRNEKWMQQIFERKPLTIEEAKLAVSFWCWNIYGNTPHKGLGGRTPREVWEANPMPAERRIAPERLNYLMLSEMSRTIQKEGVRLLGRMYWHRDLIPRVGQRVLLRYDLADIRQALVYDERDRFICTAELRETVHAFVKLTGDKLSELDYQRQLSDHRHLKKQVHQKTKLLLDAIPPTPLSLYPTTDTALFEPHNQPALPAPEPESEPEQTETANQFNPRLYGVA